ncbi:hypothetical protein AAEZ42_10170 [Limosilactobacillus fermentum]
MESIEAIIQQQQLAGKLFGGFFGLEVEQHRVLTNGKLSRHPYPAAFSSRRHNPYLKTDFCDNMFELVAPPFKGPRRRSKTSSTCNKLSMTTWQQTSGSGPCRLWRPSPPMT